jgi:hypothetical protein
MKSFITLTLLFVLFNTAFSNVLPTRCVSISKLGFSENGWELMLKYWQIDPDNYPIDSIQLISSTDTAIVANLQLVTDYTGGYLAITSAMFDQKFNINLEGDSLIINLFPLDSYVDPYYSFNILRFGNIEHAMVRKPNANENIISVELAPIHDLYSEKFIICKKEQDYANADSCHCNMLLKGKLYNKNNELVNYGQYWLDNWFAPDAEGNFEVQVLNYPHQCDKIFCTIQLPSDGTNDYYHQMYHAIQTLNFDPDTAALIEADIHLTSDIPASGIKTEKSNTIEIFPNPIINKITITGNISNGSICTIIDLKGSEVALFNLASKTEQTLALPVNLVSGFYIVNIGIDGKTYFTQKIIVNSFQ